MVRLQRYLASCGVASRRKAEAYITAGRVAVNGQVITELGSRVDPVRDRVSLDGRHVLPQGQTTIVLHKPPGCISSTHDPEGRQTVLDLVRMPGTRLYPVGRLDYNTSGVLLLTNDGALAQRLMHPRYQIAREYHVKVADGIDTSELEQLRQGVVIDGGQRVSAEVAILAVTGRHAWISMTLRQGLNHQIHRMLEAIDRRVLKLIRVSFADIRADDLQPTRYRELTQVEVDALREACGLRRGSASPKTPTRGRSRGRR